MKLVITFISLLILQVGCNQKKENMKKSNGDDKYIEAVIDDFSKNDSLFERYDVFGLAKNEVLQYVKKPDSVSDDKFKMINGQPYLGLMQISLRVNPISLSKDSKSKIGTKGITIPSRYKIKDGKLFFWWDSNYAFTQEAFDVFKSFGLIKELSNPTEDKENESLGKYYYFCGEDYDKFLKLNLEQDISTQNNVHLLCE